MAKPDKEESSDHQFPIVAIGASAGGLDAFKSFLRALPAKSGMAYVFIQHLSPAHESNLPEILEKVSPFPVQQITDNIHILQDHLYIIPENKIVTVVDGVLRLAPLEKRSKKANTIDLFFSSLGVVYQSYAIGVVLSGALNDGTLGLQVIKSYGGLTFAQEEGSAEFDSMPKSAIKSGAVDFILPPEKIAEHLIAINHPFNTGYTPDEIAAAVPKHDDEAFRQILIVLRVRRGVDFTYYKQSTLKRRIIRRMALNKLEKPADYLNFLRENKSEQDALYNDMLISVTNFFRDPQSFDVLCDTIFPAMISRKISGDPLRIWVAGCATGEEAYSMAICLQEHFGDKAAAIKIQIFATDISETAIAKARTGVYRQNELEGVSPSRLVQFFTKLDGNYQVSKTIRDMCVFAHHNLLKDPPFSKIDLVSCRNVMIYMEPVLQKKALTIFHYSLNENGYLVLGKSESIGVNTDIFAAYNATEKIYVKKGASGRIMNVASYGREQTFREVDKGIQKESAEKDIHKMADDAILANFMPPAVLINEKFDIVQFRGLTETWLVPSVGKPSFNILKMAREGLSFELRNLLHVANKSNGPSRKFAVFFKANNLQHFVNLYAFPLMNAGEPYYLVVFQAASSTGIQQVVIEGNPLPENVNYNESELRIEQLERELTQARADMRAVTEEQETANEELQSANEELLSGSEELQSLNEELETSREELQSINEEIMIVNRELLDRNEQLNRNRQYTEGIVKTIRDPLIILDKELRVKRATSVFYKKFMLGEAETDGRYVYEIGNGQWDIPQLRELLEKILPAKKELLDFEVTHVFPSIGKRVICLNAKNIENVNGEELILLAIEDITDKRRVEQGLAEAERLLTESKERLKFAVDSAGLGTWDYTPQSRELILDKRCKELIGLETSTYIDINSFLLMIHAEDRLFMEALVNDTRRDKNNGEFDLECRTLPVNNKTKWLKTRGRAYFNEQGRAIRIVGTLLDITAQKLNDEANLQLLSNKDVFISIASHELKTPITSLKAALQIIERIISKHDDMKTVHLLLQKGIKQVNKLIALIRDLLDVTKIQSGKLELRKAIFVLDELLKECCEELEGSTKHRIIIEGETDLTVFADKTRLEQVMINLISNAIKYSPDADKVVVNVEKLPEGVKISISDFGIGIADSQLPMIFERFYRIDDATDKYTGLGLGLYISSEIIKQHHGRIHIHSELGKGSTFWFIIPNSGPDLI